MMPASTTLASSQPRWGDQKAPITAAPKTSQNPFRHLVGRGAPCVSASSKAPAGHAAVERSRPAFIGHRNYPFVVVRCYRVQARPKDGGDEQMFGAKQQVPHGDEAYKETKRQRGAISCANGSLCYETLRSFSCSRARFRRVGLACRPRLRVAARSTIAAGVHIVLAKGR